MVQLLLSQGVDVMTPDEKKQSPMDLTALKGKVEVVE